MTPRQILLIQTSFAKVYLAGDRPAQMFFERLFTLAPEARRLFKADPVSLRGKFVDMLATMLATLRNPQNMGALLYATAKAHADYGATPAHYELVRECLLWTLRQQLGPAFKPETEEAWSALYTEVANTMQEIAAENPATTR